jgi:hypothetical protein
VQGEPWLVGISAAGWSFLEGKNGGEDASGPDLRDGRGESGGERPESTSARRKTARRQ